MDVGYDLSYGNYDDKHITDNEKWLAINNILLSQLKCNKSYNFAFLKSILDNIYNVDKYLVLTFDQLFSTFTELYWNLISKCKLKQMVANDDDKKPVLESLFVISAKMYGIKKETTYEDLPEQFKLNINMQVKMKCKDKIVGKIFYETNKTLYSFNVKEEWIKFNPLIYEFICKHKLILEKLNYYEWARFLEKTNNNFNILHVLGKLDDSTKHNDLSEHKQDLYNQYKTNSCFYCDKKLHESDLHIDHFIPWSYIKSDNLWNLVLACSKCKSEKRDNLPKSFYLNSLIGRNTQMLIDCKDKDESMEDYRSDRLRFAYNMAVFNGYKVSWEPEMS